MNRLRWLFIVFSATASILVYQNCSSNRSGWQSDSASSTFTSASPISTFVNTAASISPSGEDTYVYASKFVGTGSPLTFSCESGYSVASATSTAISGAGSCVTSVNDDTVTYGGCAGDYFLQVVCAKTPTTVYTSTDSNSQTTKLPGRTLSATDIEVPSGSLSCIPGIYANQVTHGGCDLGAGQVGYRFTAVSAPVVDTKVFTDSYAGFDGVTARVMTCPAGYKAVSATEIATSGALQCIPSISNDKVYYSGCEPTANGNYHLTAICAKISGTGISSSEPTSTTYTIANTCKPPRHYQFVVQPGDEVHLDCNANAAKSIIHAQIKDQGHALARGVMVLSNPTSKIHFWNSYILVGHPQLAYGIGDDICPGDITDNKSVMGYGNIADDNSMTVDWKAYAGAECTPGEDGGVTVYSGSYLDVWVEDPSENCVGKDVGIVSSYDTYTAAINTPAVNAVFPTSSYPYFAWTNSMSQLTSISVPPTSERSKIQVFGSVEGSPFSVDPQYTYTCGTHASALISQIYSDKLGILSTAQGVVPTIGGMGHLVLSPASDSALPYDPRLMRSFSLWVGSNLSPEVPVTTNGCCGDGKIGFVKGP